MPVSVPSRGNTICAACGAFKTCKSPFMRGVSADTKGTRRILIVGEAPNDSEDYAGELLEPRASRTRILKTALKKAGLNLSECAYTLAVKCAASGRNKAPLTKHINACSAFLHHEIESYKPDAILLLGNAALRALFKRSGVTKARRNVFKYALANGTEIPCVVSFSPGFVARDENQRSRFFDDVAFFAEAIEGNARGLTVEVNVEPTADEVRALALRAVARKRFLAIDVETDELHLHTRNDWLLLCVGLSDGVETIVVKFDSTQEGRVEQLQFNDAQRECLKILNHPSIRKCGHNFKYDWHAIRLRFGIRMKRVACDTMLLHIHIFPVQGGHDLKTVSMEELGVGDYTVELKKELGDGSDPKKYAFAAYSTLAKYCGMDCYCTVKLAYRLLSRLVRMDKEREKDGTTYSKPSEVFYNLLMPLFIPIAEMEAAGIQVDRAYLQRLDKALTNQAAKSLAKLHAIDVVKRYTKSKQRVVQREYDEKIAAGRKVRPTTLHKQLEACAFKPSSPKQVAEILYGNKFLALPVTKVTSTGAGATGGDVLEEALIGIDKKHNAELVEFVRVLGAYKKAEKLNGTFVKGLGKFIGTDNRVHTTIRLFGADTGRSSSSDPNLQNIPREDYVRRIYCGGVRKGTRLILLENDYSQLELRLAAAFSGDANMVGVYQDGRDLHTETALTVFNYTDAAQVSKEERVQCKAVNFGVIYGLTARGLARGLTLSTGAEVTHEEAEVFIEGVYNAYPDLAVWQQEMKDFAAKYGYVYTMFGTRRLIRNAMLTSNDYEGRILQEEAFRQAVNTPVQGTGGLFTLVAIRKLRSRFQTMRSMQAAKARIVLTVHDSITVECLEEAVHEVAAETRRVMIEEPIEWVGDYMNGVPIVVDSKAGKTWGDMEDLA